jgi:hypothetical protein
VFSYFPPGPNSSRKLFRSGESTYCFRQLSVQTDEVETYDDISNISQQSLDIVMGPHDLTWATRLSQEELDKHLNLLQINTRGAMPMCREGFG